MSWKEDVFNGFRLYAVTDLTREDPGLIQRIEAAYRGGADIVQLRSKVLPDAALMRLGSRIKRIAETRRKLFFVNDRIDLALALGAHGVHLGQNDIPVAVARKLAKQSGLKLWVGKSTHGLKQARAAVREGADYIGVGPVFATPTKPQMTSVGLRFVKQAAAEVSIPWVAIGGIDLRNIREVIAAGAKRVAVVRAIFAAKNPENAARELRSVMKSGPLESNP